LNNIDFFTLLHFLLVHSLSFFSLYLYIAAQKGFFTLDIYYLVDLKQKYFLARVNTQVSTLFQSPKTDFKKNFSTKLSTDITFRSP